MRGFPLAAACQQAVLPSLCGDLTWASPNSINPSPHPESAGGLPWPSLSATPRPTVASCRVAEAEGRRLAGVVEALQRDVAALQRGVAGRDEAIGDKERRILDLKHKTQVGRCTLARCW